jgi:hypothetical protein
MFVIPARLHVVPTDTLSFPAPEAYALEPPGPSRARSLPLLI